MDIQYQNHEKFNSLNIHDEYIICSEKNSFDNKSNLVISPNDNNFKGQMEKINLNENEDDYNKSINIGKNKAKKDKENLMINHDRKSSSDISKNIRRESNIIENLQDTSLELEEGIEKKD